jgi:hypothetical protein
MQIEPDPYVVDNMTVTLSNGQSISNDVGGEAGAQFFGFVGADIKSLTITDNAGNDFAFGNFYSVPTGCPVTSTTSADSASGACVSIAGADLTSNNVAVTLSAPQGTTGKLTITANGAVGTYSIDVAKGNAIGPSSPNVALDRLQIPPDVYSSITAAWAVSPSPVSNTFTLPDQWNVYGIVRHSQYNTPLESQCTGDEITAFVVNSSCTFTQTALKSDFVSQTNINGTGTSVSYGLLKPARITIEPTLCKNVKKPVGATGGITFYEVPTVTGSCNTTMVPGSSVATFPNPATAGGNDAQCGDSILLVKRPDVVEAIKSVDDYCPACSGDFRGTNGHIDNYVASQACKAHAVRDLGNFWTTDTHGESQ